MNYRCYTTPRGKNSLVLKKRNKGELINADCSFMMLNKGIIPLKLMLTIIHKVHCQ